MINGQFGCWGARCSRRLFTQLFSSSTNVAKNSSVSTTWSGFLRKLGTTLAMGGVGAVACVYAAAYASDMPADIFVTHAVRFARSAYTGAVISLDYKYSFSGLERGSNEWTEMRKAVDARAAKHLLALCQANRGIYVKAGQHLAGLTHVIPREYSETLSVLQDKAEYKPFSEVERIFQAEFGQHPDDFYVDFAREPVAAASLAQVHFAKLKATGEPVAVKVQYPDMQNMFRGDIKTIEIMMGIIGKLFPHFQFGWILPDFRKALTQELDFINEGRNCDRARRLFTHPSSRVYVPKVYWNWTTKRILTMEFCHGVKVNDVAGIRRLGLDPNDVAQVVIDNFSEQIYVHGVIHADPHPGNILVRPRGPGQAEVVLLDHGLYQELPTDIRIAYCQLWKALVLRNRGDVEKFGQALGAGQYTNLLALVLTFRTLDNTDVGLGQSMTKEDIENARKLFKGGFEDGVRMINELLESLPRELLLVLRTTNLIRSINKDLGATVNRFLVMAQYAVQGINLDSSYTSRQGSSWLSRLRYYLEYAHFKLVLKWFEWSLMLWRYLAPLIRHFKGSAVPQSVPTIVDSAMKTV